MVDEVSRAIVRGHCPNCDGDRNAEVLAEDTWEEEEGDVWARTTYSILRCLGCDWRYIRHVQACSEDWGYEWDPETGEDRVVINNRVTYWPSPQSANSQETRRDRPGWLRGSTLGSLEETEIVSERGIVSDYPELAILLDELYTALDHKLLILVTIGIRTVFDCASQQLGCDPNQNFEKLKELAAGNKISGEDKEILSILVEAGNASAHRGWKPTEDNINSLMAALENFLQRTFVIKHHLRAVNKNIPPRAGGH